MDQSAHRFYEFESRLDRSFIEIPLCSRIGF